MLWIVRIDAPAHAAHTLICRTRSLLNTCVQPVHEHRRLWKTVSDMHKLPPSGHHRHPLGCDRALFDEARFSTLAQQADLHRMPLSRTSWPGPRPLFAVLHCPRPQPCRGLDSNLTPDVSVGAAGLATGHVPAPDRALHSRVALLDMPRCRATGRDLARVGRDPTTPGST
jgi:hypothetical protein